MASACLPASVNNVAVPPENFLDCSVACAWLRPPISFTQEIHDDDPPVARPNVSPMNRLRPAEVSDPQVLFQDLYDFEFRVQDPVAMLTAEELFSQGKLVPQRFQVSRPEQVSSTVSSVVRSPHTLEFCRRKETFEMDPFLLSPKAPRCSTLWKEFLGLKKLYSYTNGKADKNAFCQYTNTSNGAKSQKLSVNRSSKSSGSSVESSLKVPLLKDLDYESVNKPSRLSHLSTSSGHGYDDLTRVSLDSEKPCLKQNTASLSRNAHSRSSNPPRVRVIKQRAITSESLASARRTPIANSSTATLRGVSVDSPRINSCGKIIFHGLERSSSSPSSFNGGARFKHRGMERSYSGNVRVTQVLNVPVGSLSKSSVFGFQLFSSSSSSVGGSRGGQQGNGKIR